MKDVGLTTFPYRTSSESAMKAYILLALLLSRTLYGCPFCDDKPFEVEANAGYQYWGVYPYPTEGAPWAIEIGKDFSKKWTAVDPDSGSISGVKVQVRGKAVKIRIMGSGFWGAEDVAVSIKIPCGVRAVSVDGYPEIEVRNLQKRTLAERRFYKKQSFDPYGIDQEIVTEASMWSSRADNGFEYWVGVSHGRHLNLADAGFPSEFSRVFTIEFFK